MGGKSASITATKLAQIPVQTSALGVVIPIGWGTGLVKPNILDLEDFTAVAHTTSTGGKGGGGVKQTTYTYSTTLILGLCFGTILGIGQVFVDKNIFATPAAAGLSIATGAVGQAVWGFMTTNHPTKALGYSGLAYAYASGYALSDSGGLPNHTFEVKFATHVTSLPDANPKDILSDFLTSTLYGVPGWGAGLVGDLTDYGNYCLASNLLLSPVIDQQVQASQFVDDLLMASNSDVYWSEGLLKVRPRGDSSVTGNSVTWTPNLTPIYALSDDSYKPARDGADPILLDIGDQSNAYNIVQVEFLDRSNQYNVGVMPAQDLANIATYGRRKQDVTTLHAVADAAIARTIAQLLLQRVLYVRGKYMFDVAWNYALLEPTDLLSITDAKNAAITNKLVRILKIVDNEDRSRSITAEEVPVGPASAPLYSHQDSAGTVTNSAADPGNVSTPYIFNPPSTLTPSGGQETWAAVGGGALWGGCQVWTSLDNTNYSLVGVINGPARYGTLTANLADHADPDSTNTLSVDLTPGLGTLTQATTADADTGVTLCMIGTELLSFRDVSLTSAYHYNLSYLRRGILGTTHAAHTSGDSFVRLDAAIFKFNFLPAQSGQTVYVKFQSFNIYGGGLQDLATVTAYTIVPGTIVAGPSPNGNDLTGSELTSTINQTFNQSTDPSLTVTVKDGAFWANSATSKLYLRQSGSWVFVADITATLTDGTVMFDSGSAGAFSFPIPANALGHVDIYVFGAGGGGGLVHGGGGSGYAKYSLLAVTPGTTVIAGTIGTRGRGEDASGTPIATAGTSSTITSPAITAGGGGSGHTAAGTAGSSSGGTTNTTGEAGDTGGVLNGGANLGSGTYTGGARQTTAHATGNAPGGGGAADGGTGNGGGFGAAGRVVIVTRT